MSMSDFAKKKEESDKRIQEALEARKKRKETENNSLASKKKSSDSRIEAALAERSKRVQSSLPSVMSDIKNRLTMEIDSYNSTKPSYGTYDSTYENQRESRINISNLRRKVNTYRNYMGDGMANSILATLDQIASGYDSLLARSRYESEDAWNKAVEFWKRSEEYKKKYSDWSDEDIQAALGLMEDGEEKEWLRNYQYERVKQFEDFSQYSQYANGAKGLGKYLSDSTYEYINGKLGVALYDALAGNFAEIHYDEMDKDEIAVYNYLYAKEGREKAEAYLALLHDRLVSREKQEISDQLSGFATELPVLSSVTSVPLSLMSAYENADNAIKYLAEKAVTGDAQLDPSYMALASGTIRDTVAEQVDWEIGNWDAFDFLYNTAMSGADSLAAGLAFKEFGGAVLGLSAAAQATNDALDRGMSDGQAFWNGLFAGVFEGLFETISIGNFNALKEVAPDSIKNIFKNLGKSMLVNASEEMLTEIANIGYDTLINGEFANYTLEELKSGAWKDALLQVLESGASGALMGIGMGTVANTMGYAKGSSDAKKVYGSDPGALVGEALEIDPNNAFAQKMQGRLDSGKKLSGGQLNKLVQQNEAALKSQDMASIQSAVAQRLTQLGETGDVGAIAAALAKRFSNQKLTRKESQLIANSQYGRRVSAEMNPENIQTGDYSSEWAEKIDTNRINVEEYSRLVEAAQLPQETVETSGGQIVPETQNVAQTVQTAAVETPAANDQQMTGKLTGKAPLQVDEEPTVTEEAETKTVTLEDASKKYGAQAQAMISTYTAGQDVAKYDAAYQMAYDMGRSGVSLSYAMNSEATQYLSDEQKKNAYNTGKDAADAKARSKDAVNKAAANGKTGWKKGGVVRGEGVTIADLKKAFNDPRGKAYKSLSTIAKVTGINIVLYKSKTDADGNFIDVQGEFDPKNPNEIRIDINAGLENISDVAELEKYVLLRTFSHEFTHFIEKWNPIQYNEFRRVVFDTMTQRGEDVNRLIELQQEKNPGMGYEAASREVVAEAMTDILPDSSFVQTLAEKHQNIFKKLLEKLKEFARNLREYFDSIGYNDDAGANALKENVDGAIKYVDSIVKLFDQVAVQAVENSQKTVAVDEVVISKNETTSNKNPNKATTVSKTESVLEHRTTEEQPAEIISKTEATTSEHGFTITDNAQYGSLEITFDGKPPVQVRDALKENKFRWNGKKGVWYGKADRRAITEALNEAFETENSKPSTAAPQQSEFEKAFRNATQEERDEVVDAINQNIKITHIAPTEIRESASAEISEEVTSNGTEEAGTVLPHRSDGQGTARLLGEVEAGDVSGDGGSGDAVADAGERGQSTVRDGGEPDHGAGYVGGHGEGSGQSGDLRGTDRVTIDGGTMNTHAAAKEYAEGKGYRIELNKLAAKKNIIQVDIYDKQGLPTFNPIIIGELGKGYGPAGWNKVKEAIDKREAADQAKAEKLSAKDTDVLSKTEEPATDTNVGSKLHEEVVEQIAQQSTEQPKGRNFVIGDSLDLPSGEKARYKANVEAIRLVKQLEAEGRYATEAEQTILSKYVGWGGLANAFDPRKAEWAKEFAELKELLTEEEYASARGSTLNAHYTDISVIKAMYDGLKQLGFTGGRMMEPSSGVGNFVGAMPADMSSKVRSWTMVELDGITGLIAKYLYPNADVRIQGFEKANIPNNFMDVAISNVPFGNYAIADKSYPKKVTSAIHNYFFAKSLDKVRPGGIVMFITSSYTMNSSDSTVRRYIMQKADLLGAIRLPDTAFKGNAGTEVVTDILVLKKRADNTNYAGEDFLEAPYTRPIAGNWSGAYINDYFNNHPEMVLGTASFTGGMYRSDSLTYKALEDKGSLADQIREAFKHIQGQMDYPAQKSPEKTNFAVERAGKKTKENGLVVKEGKVYKNTGGELIEQKVANGAAERISGMLEIRDAAKALQAYQQQGLKDTEIKKARQKLNKLYDDFVKKYGFINAQTNRSAIKNDPDSFSILALENWNPDVKKATKADIFSKNTIAPNRTVTSAKDVAEGLIVSVNQTGGVDAALIARLTGNTVDNVTRELIDSRAVFKNRDGVLETAEVYLSGNVRAKLRDAEALVPMDADYQNNVEALRAVMPEDVGYQDIFVNPGTPWIPDSVYSDFAAYMLGTVNRDWRKAVEVTRNADTGNFTVELKEKYLRSNSYNTQKWGTSRRPFLDLFDAMLNSKSVVVKYKTDDGKSVIDQDATAAANEKVEAIQKEFQEWLWKDEDRRGELATLYNETFNSIVTPKYNGDNLTVNGANAMKPLRPHQRNAVQRIISSGGNTLLAHKVGAGKTYEMAAAAMKLKQLGLVKKPMFAVPKSLVAQWGNEFMDFFPTAKLLVAEAGDFTAANRKVFMNRIANGDYDAVIVSYEQFERLPMSADFTKELYQEQIDSVIRAIEEAKAEKGGKSLSVKDLEKKRKQLQTKIDKLTDTAKDEDNIDFEQLGVDSIFVDEAHNFKNLFYTTSMTNVSGLGNKDGSKRAFDLYTKVRYLQKLNGGRGIVFATATPVMNSMSEMYIMQKYLQPDLLDQLGLSTFDAWAKQFGEVVNGVEIKPSGQGYRVKQSFSRFKNMSELQLLFRNFADVLTDIPGLKIPKMKGGKVNVVVCEPGQFQQDYMKELEKRADNIKNVDPSVDNMLKITSDGRKISYTQRMIDPTLPYEEGCKICRCADNVLVKYQESNEIKGTQIIFCDMATPKGKSSTNTTETEEIETDMESAKLYDDIKARLVKGGIPAKEIAFIHEADTDAKKKKLFADVNDGKVRVLIGSTGKMGVGMNAQKRIVAIHHLDAPWRPGDVEQRNGRAYRQGNINDEVENFTYVTEGSFDARLWDILERKQNFINQVMNGENVGRETEDTGEVTLSAAEVKALASGSPLIMEQVQLDTDIKKLESLYRAHRSAVANARGRLETDKGNIATYEKFVANGKKDLSARVDTYSEGKFSITIGKQKFTDKKDAGAQLMAEATAKANEEGYTTIGKFAGFDLRVIKTHEGIKGQIAGNQAYSFNTYPGNTTYMISHLIAKVEAIDEAVKLWEHKISEAKQDMAEQEKLINQPFAKQAELEQKRARYNEVMEILNPKEEQSLDNMDEDAVQYQRRKNQLTNREVLALAASELQTADLSAAERDALGIFQQRLAKLETLQEERSELGRLYKEQQFGANVDRAAAEQTRNRMQIMDGQIEKAKADVLSIEDKQVLNRVLQKARNVVEKQQWIKDEEKLKRWRDRRNNADAVKKYRERLRKDVNDLTSWVLHPNNKDVVKHIPDALKNSVLPFLSSIDFTSKQALRGGNATKADQEFMKRLNGLKAALKPQQNLGDMYEGYTDLPPNFMERLQTFIDAAQAIVNANSGEFVVNQMTSNELRELSQVVRTLKEYIQNFNKFHYNAMYQHVHEAGDNTIGELGQMDKAGPHTGGVSNFVFWQQMRPAYAWERFGEGGKAIYDGLRRGQAKLAFNTKVIVNFSEKAYTEAEVKAWEKQIKEIKLGGDIVKMPVSTIMSFYELSKRPQALGHIIGQGIRVATYKSGGKKISDIGHAVTVEDVQTIIGTLTDRQKEVADSLQKFMQEQGGKWGNYVSMKRFGEELFGEDHYFPINSDGRHLTANADEHPSAASLYALLNMGFTKSTTEGANNRLVLYSIFDVFANHMASMAQYNALALPVVDALKWFNYQQKSEPDENGQRFIQGSVRDQMDRVYGVPEETRPGSGRQGYAQTFVVNILKAFNGTEAQGVPTDSIGIDALHRYNVAQVAYNFRVVVQQPLAIARAALLIDYRSIIKGMKLSPAAIQQNIREMQSYSGIAAWKSLGFYDVNISRGLTDIIKHDTSTIDKISDFGMKGAEVADTLTWAGIWSACKEEVIKKQRLTPKSDGFYDAVTKLFEEVIYKTQVVDSVLTKNEYLRSKGLFARLTGSFMSEPTTTASMLINAYDKYHADMQRGMTRQQAWKKNGRIIGRTAYVYALSAAILAAVQAVADAFRDDDDYETFLEKWLEAFGGNLVDELMPFNKLPILSDFYDLAKELIAILGVDTYGNPPQSVFMQWYDSLVKGAKILYDKIAGEDTNYTWYGGIYKLLQAVSGSTGLPMAAVTREIIAAWNNIVGAMAPSLKVKTYDSGEKNEIKYAYQDGYLTTEEAAAELLKQGLVDNEDEAYWTVQGWEAGEGYSRYDAIYDVVRNGGDFKAAMDELTSHGYEKDDVLSQVKRQIGDWYKNGEITKQQATDMLTKYSGLDSEDITSAVNKWSSKVVTGIAFEDIKDEYLAGNITASRAIEMYVRYGGYAQEKATETVTKWGAEKDIGIAYDDIKDAFMNGDISVGDAKNMYITYGGLTEEKANENVTVLAFVKKYPETDGISYSGVEAYQTYCKSRGVPAATFYDVWKYKSSAHADVDANGETISGSKKVKVLAYINSLNLTYAQKDSLYYAFGWAQSTIYEAPWH
jgi:N12 class adenine-specific DNA methylase